VFQKGISKQSKTWDPKAPAYGRYWKDVPGAKPRRVVVSLGIHPKRINAERLFADKFEDLKINSAKTFRECTSAVTFKDQAEEWLRSLKRKREPPEQTTIDNRRYALDRWIYPRLGDVYLADVNNYALRDLVTIMAASLAPATVRDYANIVKYVVDSATDENGEARFPRKWNDQVIDAPTIDDQNSPTTTCAGMSDMLLYARGQYRMLYALLAGCGPMRPGEALGLEIDKHISPDFRTLDIVQKAKRGKIQPYLKNKNGKRQIDLCRQLAEMLREYVGNMKSGLLFHTSTGAQLLQTNILSDSLHPILDYMAHERGGLYIFRRFRRTNVQTADCPEVLSHYWTGHSQTHVSERYTKLLGRRDFRLKWAEKIGLGFELPPDVGQLGQLQVVSKVA